MERHDVIVLQIDLDEGLPVVVAGMHLRAMEDVPAEVQLPGDAAGDQIGQIGGDPALAGLLGHLEDQAVPALHRIAAQVQAGIFGKVRRTAQLTAQTVSPAVQRADHVIAGVAAALEHHGLAVATHVGQQLDALVSADQHPALALLRQRLVVPHLGHHQFVPDVARPGLEEQMHLLFVEGRVEVAGHGQLGATRLERDAQVGHDPQISPKNGLAAGG